MGLVKDISPAVSVEVRRKSVAFIITGAIVDQNGNDGRIEIEYTNLEDLKKAIKFAEDHRYGL